MGIPKQQLETWSHRPDPSRSAETYASVRTALEGSSRLKKYGPDVYLQGSYANSTNVRADSDVDVVCQMTQSWIGDIRLLDVPSRVRYNASFANSSLTWADFRRDVLVTLQERFSPRLVSEGTKCLKVAASPGRLPVDVLVAQEYRLYTEFSSAKQSYIEGVQFWDTRGRWIVNYPKLHRTFGEMKQSKTGDRYKAVVRTVKNARRRAVDDSLISRSTSPSYFVECLLSNVPDDEYDSDLTAAYLNVLIWLGKNVAKFPKMQCQNRVTPLFGPESTQWNVGDAERLVNALIAQWNSW